MDNQVTHILLIEESTGDAALIRFMLEQVGLVQQLGNAFRPDETKRRSPENENPESYRQVHTNVFSVEYHMRLSSGLNYLLNHPVDIVLLGLDLPDGKGLEAFHAICTHKPDVPVILLTSFRDETLALEAIRHGAQDYLVKGQINEDALQRAIRYAIERKRAQMALEARLRYEEGITACSRALLSNAEPAVALQQALESLRFATKSIWVGLFFHRTVATKITDTSLEHEAYATSFAPLRDKIDSATKTNFETCGATLASGQAVYGPIRDTPESICACLYESGLRSMLALPILPGHLWYGSVVFADTLATRTWGEEDINLLHTAVDMISTFLQTQRDGERRAVLLREVNHRVKNNLAAIVGFLYTEMEHTTGREQPLLQELITRVQGLATVHKLLSASEWAPLPLTELTRQVITSSLDAIPINQTVVFQVPPSSIKVSPGLAHHFALIVNELTTNVVKYALQPPKTCQIDVSITGQNDNVRFEFRDNGPGYSENMLRSEDYGVGFDLIQRIVRQNLNGQLSLLNDRGAVVRIDFSHVSAEKT